MKQLTGITTDQVDATVDATYSLISAVGENVQYQHNSSSGISICLDPIQWHSKRSILDTELQIYFNILPPYQPCKGDARGGGGARGGDQLLRSVPGNQIEIHTLVEKPKLSKFQTVLYLFG